MSNPYHSELLLSHAGGLRRLARALIHDAHEAEDVLQETFAVALERAPAQLDRPGAWLRQVLRSVVHKRLRGSERRRQRERSAARSDHSADSTELVARSEVLSRVVDAVQSLDPALREVVLLRHFEGLPPRIIAQRLGAPVSTINGRLQRAHAELRQLLDEDGEGHWVPGLLLCFGLNRETQWLAGGLFAGVFALTSSVLFKCSAVAAALIATALVWPDAPSTVLRAPDSLRAPTLLAGLKAPTHMLDAGMTRQAIVDSKATEPVPFIDEGPRDYHLRVYAVGQDDLPIEGASLFLSPPGIESNLVGRTNRYGWVEVHWIGREQVMEIDWALRNGYAGTHLSRIKLVAGRRYELAGSLLSAETDAVFDPGVRHLDSHLQAAESQGNLRFQSRAASFDEIEDHDEAGSEPPGAAGAPSKGWMVHGRALLDSGAPAADVPIGYGTSLSRLKLTRTDPEGWFKFGGYQLGKLVMFAGGGDEGRVTSPLDAHEESDYIWNPVLDRATELRGSVIFYDGTPAADWLVTVSSAGHGEPFADQTRTDVDGHFAVPNCPLTKLRVRARPRDSQSSAPWVEQEGVLAASGHLGLLVPYQKSAQLNLPGTENRVIEELRLLHQASGAISWMRPDEAGRWSLDGLPPGFFLLESLCGARGSLQTSPFYVFPEEEVTLYPWLIPLESKLELRGLPTNDYLHVIFDRLDGPVLVELHADLFNGPPELWQLPHGDYTLRISGHPQWTRTLRLLEGQHILVEFENEEEPLGKVDAQPDAEFDAEPEVR